MVGRMGGQEKQRTGIGMENKIVFNLKFKNLRSWELIRGTVISAKVMLSVIVDLCMFYSHPSKQVYTTEILIHFHALCSPMYKLLISIN